MALPLPSQNWLLRPSGKFNLLQTPKAAIYSALNLWNFQNKFPQSKAIPKDISVPEALDYYSLTQLWYWRHREEVLFANLQTFKI